MKDDNPQNPLQRSFKTILLNKTNEKGNRVNGSWF